MDNQKEVYFNDYCGTCIYELLSESQPPCDECLMTSTREYSHKPINWKGVEENE